MFLTREQLEELTGYRQPARQIGWLRKNGVQHFVRADGHPTVRADSIAPDRPTRTSIEPNFDALPARH
ncbi:MAG TPA: DUF4224 domain-containing protein [Steroidobacteraceae bacterium]|jgi:hypothetical protein